MSKGLCNPYSRKALDLNRRPEDAGQSQLLEIIQSRYTPAQNAFHLGRWLLVEKNVGQWARDRGLPEEEIEQFLEEIRRGVGR